MIICFNCGAIYSDKDTPLCLFCGVEIVDQDKTEGE
jgi:hypothetical protein